VERGKTKRTYEMICKNDNGIADQRDTRRNFSCNYHNYCGEKCSDYGCNPISTNEQFYPLKMKGGAATEITNLASYILIKDLLF
jgi:hypothetical protein